MGIIVIVKNLLQCIILIIHCIILIRVATSSVGLLIMHISYLPIQEKNPTMQYVIYSTSDFLVTISVWSNIYVSDPPCCLAHADYCYLLSIRQCN